MSNEIPAAAQSVAQDEPGRAPIRGIVMILLAVAVLLGCWAFFAKFNSSHDDAAGTAAQSSQSASKDAGATSDEADKPQVESGAKPSSSDGAQPADKDKDKDMTSLVRLHLLQWPIRRLRCRSSTIQMCPVWLPA